MKCKMHIEYPKKLTTNHLHSLPFHHSNNVTFVIRDRNNFGLTALKNFGRTSARIGYIKNFKQYTKQQCCHWQTIVAAVAHCT